jgi:hypothetical protein
MDTRYDFGPETGERIVYVREVAVADLPEEIRAQAMGLDTLYALHPRAAERHGAGERALTRRPQLRLH